MGFIVCSFQLFGIFEIILISLFFSLGCSVWLAGNFS